MARSKKYNPIANKLKYLEHSKSKVWFIGGNCIDGVQAGGAISSVKDVEFLLSRRHQWLVIIMAFGLDNETGNAVVRTEEIAFNEVIGKEELKVKLDPYLNDFVFRIGNYGGIELISSGYLISPSLEADLDGALPSVIERFKSEGAYNRILCNIADEFRVQNKEGVRVS